MLPLRRQIGLASSCACQSSARLGLWSHIVVGTLETTQSGSRASGKDPPHAELYPVLAAMCAEEEFVKG